MAQAQSSSRIPELDGIRGLAILSVLCFHYISIQGGAPAGSVVDRLQRLVILGGTGVDLFFVLSGFLIGGILLDVKDSPRYFRTFYARRIFRIIPVYFAWITAYILIVRFAGKYLLALSHSGNMPPLGYLVYNHYLFLQNFYLDKFHNLAGAWFDHTWSLAVEEQFYVVIPLLVYFLPRKAYKIFLFCVILLEPLLRIVLLKTGILNAGLIGQLTFTRADVLAVGALAALYWREENARAWLQNKSRAIYLFLFLLFLGFVAFWVWSPYQRSFAFEAVGYSVVAFFYVTLLLAALCIPGGPVSSVARWSLLRKIGAVSYCMYLIHIVANVACHAVLLRATPKISTPLGAAVTVFAALLTYVIALISWRIFEEPLLERGHVFRY
ncbi:MAG TPA: acyltransferase [Candidatus Dormibacteraeota bacterium]|jgi:peptidoglycan/LPS O-acetylase OafA/YrhL|nr:acyltransferase [Candidatus Dormibacteraeota bacterium]